VRGHLAVREAILDALLPVEQERLHRAWAQVLDDTGPQLAERALHLAHAGEPDRALPALLRAAERAAAESAFAEQSRLLTMALDCWDAVEAAPASTGTARPTLLISAAAAASWAGDFPTVLELASRAETCPRSPRIPSPRR
jgi:hypothetical protein